MTASRLDIPHEALMPVVEEIAAHCGMETALLVVRHLGGCRFYIPRQWREGHELNIIGEARAKDLIARLGGTEMAVPRRPFTARGLQIMVSRLIKEGNSQRDIARALDISMRTVRDVRRGREPAAGRKPKLPEKDPRQIDLEEYLKSA